MLKLQGMLNKIYRLLLFHTSRCYNHTICSVVMEILRRAWINSNTFHANISLAQQVGSQRSIATVLNEKRPVFGLVLNSNLKCFGPLQIWFRPNTHSSLETKRENKTGLGDGNKSWLFFDHLLLLWTFFPPSAISVQKIYFYICNKFVIKINCVHGFFSLRKHLSFCLWLITVCFDRNPE